MQRLSASRFTETFYLEKRVHLYLVTHNPIVIHFSQWPQHSCHRFLFFLGSSSFSAFHLVVYQPCNLETDQPYNRFHFFIELALGRMPIFTRRSRAGTSQMIPARLSKNGPWLLLSRMLLFLDTLRPREKVGSESVAALWSGFFAHDLGSRGGIWIGLLANTGFFSPLVTNTFDTFNADS